MNVPVDRPRRCIARYPIPGMSMHTVRNGKREILTCEGNKALFVGANQGLPCCVEDVRCQTGRKGELVRYTVEKG